MKIPFPGQNRLTIDLCPTTSYSTQDHLNRLPVEEHTQPTHTTQPTTGVTENSQLNRNDHRTRAQCSFLGRHEVQG